MAELKTFQCPNCGSPVHVNGSEKQVKCEYCGTTVVVPEELREPEAPAATPIEINFGQMAPASDEIFKTVETVGKVTAGVTLVSAILPVVLTCVILAFVGGVLYFVFSSVGNITNQVSNLPSAPLVQPTIAPTLAPTPFDTPVPFSKVLFKDNFTEISSGWEVSHKSDYTLEYKGGKYHMLINKQGSGQAVWVGETYTNFSLEVDAQKTSGPDDGLIGVTCRATDSGGMYSFEFSPDGEYGIYKYDSNGNADVLAEGTLDPNTVSETKTNHIEGVCQGDTLTLILNGQVLLQATDEDYTKGGAGLIVRTGGSGEAGIDVLFSNFIVKGP